MKPASPIESASPRATQHLVEDALLLRGDQRLDAQRLDALHEQLRSIFTDDALPGFGPRM